MRKSLLEFTADIRGFASRLKDRELVAFHKKISLDAFARIQRKTPVDTGRARASWRLSLDRPDETEEPKRPRRKKGERKSVRFGGSDAAATGRALTQLASLRPFQVVFITNNLPYIVPLENGYSNQAPQGMVALTILELAEQFP